MVHKNVSECYGYLWELKNKLHEEEKVDAAKTEGMHILVHLYYVPNVEMEL